MSSPFEYSRKSGLVRQLSAFDVFLVNTFGYSLGVALTTNPTFIGGFSPSANIYLVLFGGLLAALSSGFVYGLFSVIIPKTGGDYWYVTRTLGMWLGFIASVGFTVGQIYGFALDCFWSFTQALSPALTTYGMVTGNQNLVRASAMFSNETTALYITIGYMVLMLCISLLGLRFTKWLFLGAFVIALLGPILQAIAFFSIDHATFVARFDQFMQSTNNPLTYASIISLGSGSGLSANSATMLSDSIRSVPLGFLCFLGFTYSVYMGSEVKEASKSQMWGVFGALGIGALFFFGVMGRYFHVVGNDFNAALSAKEVGARMPAGTSLAFFAGIILKNHIANAIMNLGNCVWFALTPLVILQVSCRNIQAWALDLLLPKRFARINRYGAQTAAALATVILGLLFLLIAYRRHNYTPVGAVAVVAFSVLLSGVSAVVYPIRHPSEFRTAPALAQRPFLGFTFFQMMGVCTSAIFLWILIASVAYPEISGTESWAVLYLVIAVYAIASIWFLSGFNSLKRKLAKVGLTMKDIWGSLPED